MSRVIAIGVGPGDPELITLKGARAVREADVVVTPAAESGGDSIAYGIVAGLIDPARQEVVTRIFPMTRDRVRLEAAWEQAAREMAAWARAGKTVAFVTLGDPSLYSTFLYLHRHLRQAAPEIQVEIVPGVNSFSAAAAAAGIPLALGDEKLAVLPATAGEEEVRRALLDFDTVVLLKVNRAFDRIRELLAEPGLDRRAVFVRRVGSGDEEVVFDLERLAGKELDYLSLLIVRK
jgi:precorrin-2/cobalt-factor-2 C20-methyltransferase